MTTNQKAEQAQAVTLGLSHFTHLAVLEPKSVPQEAHGDHKPQGLWVSVNGPDDWPSWCRSEEWGLGSLKHQYAVTLAGESDVLRIATPDELRAFDAAFADSSLHGWGIRWRDVAERWQGIIIAPYQWECRLTEPRWYYGWDCASGCIWDASAIDSVRLLDLSTLPDTTEAGDE